MSWPLPVPEPLPVPVLPLPLLGWGAALVGAVLADGCGLVGDVPLPELLVPELGMTLARGDGVIVASVPLPVSVGFGVGLDEAFELPVSEPTVVDDELLCPVSAEIGFWVIASNAVMTPIAIANTRTAAPMSAGHFSPLREPMVSQPRRHQLCWPSAWVSAWPSPG